MSYTNFACFVFSFSGRTSRREIRRLLTECLFWRCKKTTGNRLESKVQTHSFLSDDDGDDMDRSIGTTGGTIYCPLTAHPQNRSDDLSRQNSHRNCQSSRTTPQFTCCGLRIDLSRKYASYLSNNDLTLRYLTVGKSNANTSYNKYYGSPRKYDSYSHSPGSSSFNHHLRKQQASSYKINHNNNRSITRRRAIAAVHCFHHLSSSTVTALTDQKLPLDIKASFAPQSISNEKQASPMEALLTDTFNLPSITIDTNNGNTNSTKTIIDSTSFV